MFKKNDPLVDAVKSVMIVSDSDRQAEAAVNEAFGVVSRKQIPHEHQAEYDAALIEAKKMCQEKLEPHEYSDKQRRMASAANRFGNKKGSPNVIDKHDMKAVRDHGHIEELEEDQLDELKKSTLKSYVGKAEKELFQGIKSKNKDKEYNRQHGVDKASERLETGTVPVKRSDMKLDPEDVVMKKKYHFKEEETLEEKAVSKAQHRFFGLVRGIQKGKAHGSEKAEKAAKEMSVNSVRDYAKTKEKGLPEKVEKKEIKESFEQFLRNKFLKD